MLQSLAVNQVRDIADRLRTRTPNADNSITYTQNTASEGVRAALQALVGCAGSAASGSGSCSSAAAGAAASVVLNALINDLTGRASETINPSTQRRDANGNAVNPLTLEEQQSRSNLIATLVAGITAATGGNINAAVTAAQIETENNQNNATTGQTASDTPGRYLTRDFFTDPEFSGAIAAAGGIEAYEQYVACLIPGNPGRLCGTGDPDRDRALHAAVNRYSALNGLAVQQDAANPGLAAFRDQNRDIPIDVLTAIYASAQQQDTVDRFITLPNAEAALRNAAATYGNDSPEYYAALRNYNIAAAPGRIDQSNGNPPGTTNAHVALLRYRAALVEARSDAEIAQLNRWVACAALCIPAIVGTVVFAPVILPAISGYVTTATGLSGPAATVVSGTIGGGINLGITEGSTRLFLGRPATTGERFGAAASGFIFSPGVSNLQLVSRFSPTVNGAINGGINGGLSSGLGNSVGQGIDIYNDPNRQFRFSDLGVATAIGAGAGGVAGTVSPYYGPQQPFDRSGTILFGAGQGARAQINALPQTLVNATTQLHLDAVNSLFNQNTEPPRPAPVVLPPVTIPPRKRKK